MPSYKEFCGSLILNLWAFNSKVYSAIHSLASEMEMLRRERMHCVYHFVDPTLHHACVYIVYVMCLEFGQSNLKHFNHLPLTRYNVHLIELYKFFSPFNSSVRVEVMQ